MNFAACHRWNCTLLFWYFQRNVLSCRRGREETGDTVKEAIAQSVFVIREALSAPLMHLFYLLGSWLHKQTLISIVESIWITFLNLQKANLAGCCGSLPGHHYMVDKVLSGFSAHCYAVARVFGQLLGGCLLIQVECPPPSLYDILMGLLLNSSLKDFFHLL